MDKPSTSKRLLGTTGEDLAAEYLERAGYSILTRNWRCPQGEIDIVAFTQQTIVVVEVKTRSGVGFGHPFEAITPPKLARLRRLAAAWRDEWDAAGYALRIDVIGIVTRGSHAPTIEHLENVF